MIVAAIGRRRVASLGGRRVARARAGLAARARGAAHRAREMRAARARPRDEPQARHVASSVVGPRGCRACGARVGSDRDRRVERAPTAGPTRRQEATGLFQRQFHRQDHRYDEHSLKATYGEIESKKRKMQFCPAEIARSGRGWRDGGNQESPRTNNEGIDLSRAQASSRRDPATAFRGRASIAGKVARSRRADPARRSGGARGAFSPAPEFVR